jgi:hypothetical protein
MDSRQKRVTDAQFNEIFARNHGAEEIAYYNEHPIYSVGSMWDAMMDAQVRRGANRRTRAAARCE